MNETLKTLLILALGAVVGYLCGCFSMSAMLARRRGFDIRSRGSHNAGASNAAITMGWRAGVLVGFCDIVKCFIPVFAAKLAFPDVPLAPYVTGIFCVLGHMHPFNMRFRGGKGFASYIGMMLGVNWKVFLIVVGLLLLFALASNYIVFGTAATVVSFPIFSYIFERNLPAALLVVCLSLYILWRHRRNFKDIAAKKERKIFSVLKKKKGEYEDK